MIYEANKNINEIFSMMMGDKDAFVLSLNRFVLRKGNWYVDTDYDGSYVAVSDNLDELKKYMTDNDLTSYLEIDGNKVKKRYYYFYEIFRYYVDDNDNVYVERVESCYDTLYYDGGLNYYKEEALEGAILWRICYHGEHFTLSSWREMYIDEDTILICSSRSCEIFETIKIKDLGKRKDIIDEIIRNNFEKVEDMS